MKPAARPGLVDDECSRNHQSRSRIMRYPTLFAVALSASALQAALPAAAGAGAVQPRRHGTFAS
jgi:hypothetical protein